MKHRHLQSVDPGGFAESYHHEVVDEAFSPHRHDTYTIAITVRGIQSFNYRKNLCHSVRGNAIVLHPDELHDGFCSDDAGFAYWAAHIPPADIQSVFPCESLPFLAGGVARDARLISAIQRLIDCCRDGADPFAYDDAIYDLTVSLRAEDPKASVARKINREAVMRVRDFLDSLPDPGTGLCDMERIAGVDRWQLSREFRVILGTSPYRYLQCRRVDHARQQMLKGTRIADAAHDAGFADQSHFGREFKKAFGMSPASWLAKLAAHDPSIGA